MGRLSQIFWYLQAEEAPTVDVCEHCYTSIDAVSSHNRAGLNRMRREYRKITKETVEESGMLPFVGYGEHKEKGDPV